MRDMGWLPPLPTIPGLWYRVGSMPRCGLSVWATPPLGGMDGLRPRAVGIRTWIHCLAAAQSHAYPYVLRAGYTEMQPLTTDQLGRTYQPLRGTLAGVPCRWLHHQALHTSPCLACCQRSMKVLHNSGRLPYGRAICSVTSTVFLSRAMLLWAWSYSFRSE